ncbi:MAG: YncE family protein [Gemmatimonadetes bacterium]|nr:YncE family protein [Gemmatimonadota bacterium]
MRLAALALSLAAATTAGAQAHTIVALSHNDHTVYELDPVSGRILNQFKALEQPHEGVPSPDGKTFYVAVPNGPHVVVLETRGFTQLAKIESPFFTSSARNGSASPHGSALTADGSRLYVGLENADVPGIVVIDTKSRKVVKKIDVVLRGGHFLAIQPVTDKLYYPMRDDNRVLVIDTKTDAITKIITVPGGPVGVGFAPNGDVWIHCDRDGSVAVIDSKRDSVVETLKDLGKGAGRMAVSPDGRWAASTHGGTEDVALIDARTRQVAATIKIGAGPSAFPVFSPDGSKLYAMNVGTGEVIVIDTETRSVVARHKVGTNPFGGGILIRK